MYLVAIGWLYVALLMGVAEATNSNGSLLGAIVTFFLYGLMPVALVIHLMNRTQRGKKRTPMASESIEATHDSIQIEETRDSSTAHPDASGHSTGAAKNLGIAPVREE